LKLPLFLVQWVESSPRVVEALTASQGLNEHLPRLYWPQCRHQIYTGEEEALRFDDAAFAKQHAHPFLGREEERICLTTLC
jgi:hypothetical protein